MNPEILRIIDANFNRSREALRVMEEYARFALDDAGTTAEIKALRHELTTTVRGLAPDDERLGARGTAADVGTAISDPGELRRDDAESVCAAAAGRLAESLRALEEYGKVLDVGAASAIEEFRYRVYSIEQTLRLRDDRHERMRRARLYVVVTASLCTLDWLETVERVARAGADAVQLREKELSDRQLQERAQAAAGACRAHGTLFFVNDRPDIARLCGADGVHVGQDDLPVAAARRIAGPRMLVGVSTHNAEQLEAALGDRPDYVAVGPMFASQTKLLPHIPGPELLALSLWRTELPVVAIGGINAQSLRQLSGDRPFCIAVCSAVISHTNPDVAVVELLERFKNRPQVYRASPTVGQ